MHQPPDFPLSYSCIELSPTLNLVLVHQIRDSCPPQPPIPTMEDFTTDRGLCSCPSTHPCLKHKLVGLFWPPPALHLAFQVTEGFVHTYPLTLARNTSWLVCSAPHLPSILHFKQQRALFMPTHSPSLETQVGWSVLPPTCLPSCISSDGELCSCPRPLSHSKHNHANSLSCILSDRGLV